MEEDIKAIYIPRERLARLSEQERRDLYARLGSLGLIPKREKSEPLSLERKRSFLSKAYPREAVPELTEAEIEATMAALTMAISSLPPKKKLVFNARNLSVVERWISGERYVDIAREERMGSIGNVGNIITRFAKSAGERIPYEMLEDLRNQFTDLK